MIFKNGFVTKEDRFKYKYRKYKEWTPKFAWFPVYIGVDKETHQKKYVWFEWVECRVFVEKNPYYNDYEYIKHKTKEITVIKTYRLPENGPMV